MKLHPRDKNRSKKKISQDIVATETITREDIHELVKNCETKAEAEAVIREVFQPLSVDLAAFKGDKNKALVNVLSDLSSYKVWHE